MSAPLNETAPTPGTHPYSQGIVLSWVLLAVAVVIDAPASGASPGSVLALLGVSAFATVASVLIPRGVRRAMVSAMPLETVEDPDPMAPQGSYRVRPPAPRRRVDPGALRAATASASAHGSLDGIVLALAVSICGLMMKILGGHLALVTLLFVGSWSLTALYGPGEDRGDPEWRKGKPYVVLLLAAGVLWCLFFWRACKAESDQAEALAARASTTVATIDDRQETFDTTTDLDGFNTTTRRNCSVAYHLNVAGVRYAGSTGECSCYAETKIGGTSAAIYDPAAPAQSLISCAQRELASRAGEHVLLLLAGMGVSILILLGARPAKQAVHV